MISIILLVLAVLCFLFRAHELANVQLSHYRCNLEKHNGHHPDGDGEQLMLIG